jgi:hypothetical protein
MSNYLSRSYKNYLEDHASLAELNSYYGTQMATHRTPLGGLHKAGSLANGYASSFKAFGTAPGSYVGPIYDDQVKQSRGKTLVKYSIREL